METNTYNFMDASQALMARRAQLEAAKEQEKQARADLATAILMDAIEQPSRILRLDKYWRMTGILPMQIESMVVRAIQDSENPAFSGLKTSRHAIRLRYAELDEDGRPTGGFIERVQEMPLIINLGRVLPPRNIQEGEEFEEPVMGWGSLIEKYSGCNAPDCYYIKHDWKCPYTPEQKWKCANVWKDIRDPINEILNQE